MISACAELAKRLVSGLGLASEDDKGSVSNWVTFAPKPEAKGDTKLTNTLVVVGYATYAKAVRASKLTLIQYVLDREGAYRERSVYPNTSILILTTFSSYCESFTYKNLLRFAESSDPSLSIRPRAARNVDHRPVLRKCSPGSSECRYV